MKHTTLEELADQFDAFFIDQFGVLMDASGPYPFAVDPLEVTLPSVKLDGAQGSGKAREVLAAGTPSVERITLVS